MPTLVQLFANSSSAPGGAEKIMGRIGKAATQCGFDVVEYNDHSFPLTPISNRFTMLNTPGNIWQLNWRVRRIIREADVVVSHGMYGAFVRHPRHFYVLHSTYAGMAEAMKPFLPRLDFNVLWYLWGYLEKRNARAAQCIAVSQRVREEALRFYDRSSYVLHNCVEPFFARRPEARSALRQRLDLPENEKIILVVGRRETLKGVRLLEPLARRLPPGVRLVSVGAGRDLTSSGIICLPPQPHENLPSFYAAADWTLIPSLYEGFGLTILESWACGTPVLASHTGLVCELAKESESLRRCIPTTENSAEALTECVLAALTDASVGLRQIEWATTVLPRFSVARFEEQWASLLSQITSKK